MLHYLQAYDLTGFSVRRPPQTKGLANQKIEGLKGFDKYWLGILQKGELPKALGFPDDDGWPRSGTKVVTTVLYEFYCKWTQARRYQGDPPSEDSMGSDLKKACPASVNKRIRRKDDHNRYYFLPPLADCRKAFADHLRISVDHLPTPSSQNEQDEDEYEDEDDHDDIDDLLK